MSAALFNNFFPSQVTAFTTDQRFDFALPKEANVLTLDQREVLSEMISRHVDRVVNIRQVHGNKIILVDKTYLNSKRDREEADGLITNLKQVPIVIRTADCLPIFVFDQKQYVIAAVHAGWKGTKIEILRKTLELMQNHFKSSMTDIKIAFGPAIRSCCYEVGQEFVEYFPQEVKMKNDKHCFDVALANKNQALREGVLDKNIFDCEICTHCRKEYFSFRRDKEKAGRMLSLMMLN